MKQTSVGLLIKNIRVTDLVISERLGINNFFFYFFWIEWNRDTGKLWQKWIKTSIIFFFCNLCELFDTNLIENWFFYIKLPLKHKAACKFKWSAKGWSFHKSEQPFVQWLFPLFLYRTWIKIWSPIRQEDRDNFFLSLSLSLKFLKILLR